MSLNMVIGFDLEDNEMKQDKYLNPTKSVFHH